MLVFSIILAHREQVAEAVLKLTPYLRKLLHLLLELGARVSGGPEQLVLAIQFDRQLVGLHVERRSLQLRIYQELLQPHVHFIQLLKLLVQIGVLLLHSPQSLVGSFVARIIVEVRDGGSR